MKYITAKWSDLKYKSGCSDVIWNTRILLRKMDYDFVGWSVSEDFPKKMGYCLGQSWERMCPNWGGAKGVCHVSPFKNFLLNIFVLKNKFHC